MNTRPKSPTPPPASITLRDIYYVLFRHKWLITILVVLGVGSSAAVYWLSPVPYVSEAKIYIRYIQQNNAPTTPDGNTSVISPDGRGDNILNTELEMLKSFDNAKEVANEIGPDKILGESHPSNSASFYENAAAIAILNNLTTEIPPKSDVILLHYTNTTHNPGVAKNVLDSLINAYKRNYVTNHLAMGMTQDYLRDQTLNAQTHLATMAKDLEDEKKKVGITSLPDFKKNVTDQHFRTLENINQVSAEMAETQSIIKDIQARGLAAMTNGSSTNLSTNMIAAALLQPPSREVLEKYHNLSATLTSRRAEADKWMTQLTPANKMVQDLQHQAAAAETEMEKFEADNPSLLGVKTSAGSNTGSPLAPSSDPLATLRFAQTKYNSLAARLAAFSNQLTQVQAETSALNVAEDSITKAETEMEVAELEYKRAHANQDQAESAAESNVPNIRTAELPTPEISNNKKSKKTSEGVLGVFLALAFGLPFFIEMVLDQSFKQPVDVKARIDAPFFLTIPRMNGHHKFPALKQTKPVALLSANGSATPGAGKENGTMVLPSTNAPLTSWEERPELRSYFETLRDRLMTYFEMINLTHKPKLVAVTSCGEGAGVTTTAAGLASSLSEVGDGKVLLVNMNVRDGEAHHFYKGKVACGIEEVLGVEKRDQAQVHEHLYVANEAGSGDSLPRVLPKRFSHLVPLMKASDYDYIIFDMPPVSEISITPRLARFMDMVLLVIESGKTSREAGIHAAALLAESKTNVGLVLNKNRSYLPKRLQNI